MKEFLSYYLLRILTFPLSYFPYSWIRIFGKYLGILAYYCMPIFRKRTLSNLALARDLNLSEANLKSIAKQSFQNLAINILEYPRLAREKDFNKVIQCENPQQAIDLFQKKQGIIFFCGHQSNWEALFLDGNIRMKGIAIGKPFKNKRLYRWIVSIREKTGGKMIPPQKALKEGLKNLKKGFFFGILGDQAMPDSHYCFPFFGRRAWTSTAPALLAYKTNSPIIVATTRRTKQGYQIHYSDPIWPNLSIPIEEEIPLLMNQSLSLLQESIKKNPAEWLWQHNRWKQQTPKIVYKEFRHDAIAIILPPKEREFIQLFQILSLLKNIFFRDFLTLFIPKSFSHYPLIECDQIVYYHNLEETKRKDYRFKLIFNFTDDQSISFYYRRLSAFRVLTLKDLKKIAVKRYGSNVAKNLPSLFLQVLCRPNTPPWKSYAS